MLTRLAVAAATAALVATFLAAGCATVSRAEYTALCPGVPVPSCSSEVDCAQDKARDCFVCACRPPVCAGPLCFDKSNPMKLPNQPDGAAASHAFPETYQSPAQRDLR